MAPEYDPVVGFARAAESMAETQRLLAQTQLRIEATQRGIAWLQGFACVMIGVAVIGLGFLIWLGVTQVQEQAVHTQALQELLRRGSGH